MIRGFASCSNWSEQLRNGSGSVLTINALPQLGFVSATTLVRLTCPRTFIRAAVSVSWFYTSLRSGLSNGAIGGIAQPNVRCGECGGVGRGGEIFQRGVRALAIVVVDRCRLALASSRSKNSGPACVRLRFHKDRRLPCGGSDAYAPASPSSRESRWTRLIPDGSPSRRSK